MTRNKLNSGSLLLASIRQNAVPVVHVPELSIFSEEVCFHVRDNIGVLSGGATPALRGPVNDERENRVPAGAYRSGNRRLANELHARMDHSDMLRQALHSDP